MASLTPPPGIDLAADEGPRIINSGIVLIILPTIFVILRFVSRISVRAGFWWDDLLLVLSLLFSYGPNIAMIVSARTNGFGRHLWALKDPEHNTSQFLKILYVYILFYYASVVCIKLCIVTFYRRVFPVTEIRIWLYISYAVIAGYAISTFSVTTFQCRPVHGFWDKSIPSTCLKGDSVLIVPGSINAVLDAFIISLPIPLLWQLRTTPSQKWVLTGIFSCAGFVCVISIIRLVVLGRLEDFDVTWNYVNAGIWSAAEPSMGVIAACIPSLRPLLAMFWRGSTRASTTAAKNSQTSTNSTSSNVVWPSLADKDERDQAGRFTRLEEGPSGRWGHNTDVHGGRKGPNRASEENISLNDVRLPRGGIRVKNEVSITTHAWEYNDKLF